ncbi:unnamed protein product [Strongylus vulgaris]|uniref:Uncharacterized protein n=1 Tax=Strongylus vulgaris TaxID=40348 RepID=A0A3P7IHA2_STRVU|nr:unnamed protein product [Strongylus vulgaris]
MKTLLAILLLAILALSAAFDCDDDCPFDDDHDFGYRPYRYGWGGYGRYGGWGGYGRYGGWGGHFGPWGGYGRFGWP